MKGDYTVFSQAWANPRSVLDFVYWCLHTPGDMIVRTLALVSLIEIIIQLSSVATRRCRHRDHSDSRAETLDGPRPGELELTHPQLSRGL